MSQAVQVEDRLSGRRIKCLKQAAECYAKAAKADVLVAREWWILAARTWRELATSSELAAQAEKAKKV